MNQLITRELIKIIPIKIYLIYGYNVDLKIFKKIKWDDVNNKLLTIRLFEKYCGKINKNKMDYDFITKILTKIDLKKLKKYIRNYSGIIDWKYLLKLVQINEDFIIEFEDKINNEFLWSTIFRNQKNLSDEFLIKYIKNGELNSLLSGIKKLKITTILKLIPKFSIDDWISATKYQNITEEILDIYHKQFNKEVWNNISYYQNISPRFIEKFDNLINWHYISHNQYIIKNIKNNEDFIHKYYDKINLDGLIYNLVESIQNFEEKNNNMLFLKKIFDNYLF